MPNKIITHPLLRTCMGAAAVLLVVACQPSSRRPEATAATNVLPPAASQAAATAITAPADTTAETTRASAPDPIPADASPAAAEETVRRYYAAINAKDYASAYALWGNDGADSRQTYALFAKGYASTASVQAQVGKASEPEGAVGSRYIQVPIDLSSRRLDGSTRHYRGNFTLRAVVAEGAAPKQRRWHLESADIEGYEPEISPRSPASAMSSK